MPIRRYDEAGGAFQWSTVHEVAHQWWYSLVGNDQQDEPWLDEALTQYSTVLFYEFIEGWNGAVSDVLEVRYAPVAGTDDDLPFTLPVSEYSPSNYGPVVYAKGPLFFHALRQQVGDEAFLSLLTAYLEAYRYRIAHGEDLLSLMQTHTDQDLSPLYQEWLREQDIQS
jgi:aminopeptidase N